MQGCCRTDHEPWNHCRVRVSRPCYASFRVAQIVAGATGME